MKKRRMHNYTPLWLLLAGAFCAVAAVSALSPLRIGSYELRDSGLVAALASPCEVREISDSVTDNALGLIAAELDAVNSSPFPAPLDTAAKTILFIGDSMLDGLYPRLAAYSEHNGHTLYTVIWYSSTSEVWGRSGKLARYIGDLKPDYVFICLGSNELFVKDIEQKRGAFVKSIVSEIGDIPYLWIGPPNWKPDTGINRLIADNTAPGTFFLSDGMTFERGKDGAHPTRTSAARWMDSVARWMPGHSAHPIRLEVPEKESARARRVFVHQPNEQ